MTQQWVRDFHGYGGQWPNMVWPGKARLALSFVLNFEEGAELAIADGDERNECVYEACEEVKNVFDPCMMSHYEYGPRAGYWRIMDLLDHYGVKVTVSANGRAALRSPQLVRDAVSRGHEISCHGWRWESHAQMDETTERDCIARCVKTIEDISGTTPVGWHTRSASSCRTRRLLMEHGGFLYDSDAYNDDFPYLVKQNDQRHVVLPYCFDTNDMRFQPGGGFVFAEDFTRYCMDAVERLLLESAASSSGDGGHGDAGPCRMLSIGLHQRIIGRPARIGGLAALLDRICGREEIWIARRRDIAAQWLHQVV